MAATSWSYDKVEWIEIGADVNNHVNIQNVVSFAERVVSPDGDMLYPMQVINEYSPVGVHDNHKYWELEMVLDTNWLYDDTAVPVEYWAYDQDVESGGGVAYAIECDDENGNIDWFKVFIREADGTQTRLIYADAATDNLWCIGERFEIDNTVGTRHQTTTYKFICFEDGTQGGRGREHDDTPDMYAKGANEDPVTFLRVDSLAITGRTTATNIVKFSDEYMMQMTPRFVPNTFEGVDLKQDQQWRILTFVLDTEADIFDIYVDITTANTVIPPNFVVTFTLADALGTTETWTYSGGTNAVAYIINRREGRYHADVPRDTIEYQILTTCDRTVARP